MFSFSKRSFSITVAAPPLGSTTSFIFAFFIAFLCDGLSTVYFMLQENRVDDELHPVIRLISYILGPIVCPLFSAIAKAAVGLLVAIYCRRFALYILLAASLISLWAAWYNVWGKDLYIPRLLKWLTW